MQTGAFRGAFLLPPSLRWSIYKMLEATAEFSVKIWMFANRLAAYALLNLIDDPAILAMAFC
jgi:hypothetical protein